MGIFDRFPYSSTHEMNLDFMLGKATEIAESLQEIDTHKEQAEQAAQAAQAAQTAAQAAQTAAQAAQTAAQSSAGQAEQHKTDAEDAADRAEAASDLADEAVEQAQTAAQNASTAADGAIASATAAETRINNLAASLPEDFTELNNTVNTQEKQIVDGMFILTAADFVQGNWSMEAPSGVTTTWYKDIRTSKAYDVQPGDRIITKPGATTLYMRFSVFDANDTLVQEYKGYYDKLSITDTVIEITAAGKLYINVANGYNAGNSTAIVPADMTAIINVANTYAARETYRMLKDRELSVPWLCEQHRGYLSDTVHSNTLPAYYRAWKNGAQSIETDVRRASDGIYIISHDPTITVDGTTYRIAETPSTTLINLVLSTDPVFGECKVPLFADVLKLCAYTGMKCNIDCKDVVVAEIAQMVVDAGMNGKCVYSSVPPTVISNILAIDPWAGFCITYSEANVNGLDAIITSEIVRHNTVFWATTISETALRITRAKGFKYMLTQVTNSNNFHYLPDIIEYENTVAIRNLNRQYLNTISVL